MSGEIMAGRDYLEGAAWILVLPPAQLRNVSDIFVWVQSKCRKRTVLRCSQRLSWRAEFYDARLSDNFILQPLNLRENQRCLPLVSFAAPAWWHRILGMALKIRWILY